MTTAIGLLGYALLITAAYFIFRWVSPDLGIGCGALVGGLVCLNLAYANRGPAQ